MRSATKILGLSFIGGMLWVEAVQAAARTTDVVQRIREKVTFERSYEVGTEIEIFLAKEEAARLDCSDNPYGLKECLICPTSEFHGQYLFFTYCILADGQVSGGGSALTRQTGALRQAGRTPCLTVASWTAKGDTVAIRFRIEHDRAKIRAAYEALSSREGSGKVSLQVFDGLALFGPEGAPMPQLSADERTIGFVRLWSEVKYNFAFFDQVPELDWDKILEQYLPEVTREQTAEEYYRLLEECIALLKDGHTSVWGHRARTVDSPALLVQLVEGKAIIAEVGTAKELVAAELKAGDEITHIDGRSVRQILRQDLYPYISASTPQERDREAYRRLLEGVKGSQVIVHVRSMSGTSRDVILTRRSESKDKPWVKMSHFEWRELSDGIVYVALNSVGREIVKEFEGILERLHNAKGLILDVRENGGGSTNYGYAIIGRLIDKPLKGSHWKTRQYMPAFRAWGRQEQWYEGDHGTIRPRKGRRYLGPAVVLTGPGTVSAAEDFVVALHAGGRATLVGERTAGTTGQPLLIDLPGGARARICTKRDTYPDGREFVGIGVIPDIEVHPTREDIAAGRDPVLEKGLEVLTGL